MFPVQLLFALAADTATVDLDAWLPRRTATLHVAGIGVAVVSSDGVSWRWHHGVESVLTRTPVGGHTVWPSRSLGRRQPRTASPHATLGAVLSPGLIVMGVWSALCWVLLIPASGLLRKNWRFGRWHEILSLLLAAPVAWLFLDRIAGRVLASYFTVVAGITLLLPFALAALAWRKSRLAAVAVIAVAALLTWKARELIIPLPSRFDAGTAAGATLDELEQTALRALRSDSLERSSLGFALEGGDWIAHDKSRGAETLLVLLPERGMAVVTASNTGETTSLLREVVDSIAR